MGSMPSQPEVLLFEEPVLLKSLGLEYLVILILCYSPTISLLVFSSY